MDTQSAPSFGGWQLSQAVSTKNKSGTLVSFSEDISVCMRRRTSLSVFELRSLEGGTEGLGVATRRALGTKLEGRARRLRQTPKTLIDQNGVPLSGRCGPPSACRGYEASLNGRWWLSDGHPPTARSCVPHPLNPILLSSHAPMLDCPYLAYVRSTVQNAAADV